MHVSIKVYNFSCAERIDSFSLLTNKAGGKLSVLSSKQERNALYNVVTNCKTALHSRPKNGIEPRHCRFSNLQSWNRDSQSESRLGVKLTAKYFRSNKSVAIRPKLRIPSIRIEIEINTWPF